MVQVVFHHSLDLGCEYGYCPVSDATILSKVILGQDLVSSNLLWFHGYRRRMVSRAIHCGIRGLSAHGKGVGPFN